MEAIPGGVPAGFGLLLCNRWCCCPLVSSWGPEGQHHQPDHGGQAHPAAIIGQVHGQGPFSKLSIKLALFHPFPKMCSEPRHVFPAHWNTAWKTQEEHGLQQGVRAVRLCGWGLLQAGEPFFHPWPEDRRPSPAHAHHLNHRLKMNIFG